MLSFGKQYHSNFARVILLNQMIRFNFEICRVMGAFKCCLSQTMISEETPIHFVVQIRLNRPRRGKTKQNQKSDFFDVFCNRNDSLDQLFNI
jgi:hypothetical protein